MREVLDRAESAVNELLSIAERGDSISSDDGFCVFVGVVRDAAYRIRREIEHELRTRWLRTGGQRHVSSFEKE